MGREVSRRAVVDVRDDECAVSIGRTVVCGTFALSGGSNRSSSGASA